MQVQMSKALVCDVVSGVFNNRPYKQALIYEKGKLYRMSIKDDDIYDRAFDRIANYASITADMTTFDNKVKFALSNIE